jgi:hypothetical protein
MSFKALLESALLAGFLSAVALAVSFSPRMSVPITWMFLGVAWLFAIVGILNGTKRYEPRTRHLTVIGSGLALALCLYFLGDWPTNPPKVMVTNLAPFSGTIDAENYTFIVTNRTDDNLYTVEILFRFEPQERFQDYDLEVPESSKKAIMDNAELADIGGLTATDAHHRNCLLVVIYKLGPHEQREISFTHKRQSQSTITARIENFTEIPQPRKSDPLTLLGSSIHVKDVLQFDLGGFVVSMHDKKIKAVTVQATVTHSN